MVVVSPPGPGREYIWGIVIPVGPEPRPGTLITIPGSEGRGWPDASWKLRAPERPLLTY